MSGRVPGSGGGGGKLRPARCGTAAIIIGSSFNSLLSQDLQPSRSALQQLQQQGRPTLGPITQPRHLGCSESSHGTAAGLGAHIGPPPSAPLSPTSRCRNSGCPAQHSEGYGNFAE